MNSLWTVTFGDYEFVLDRKSLTYTLTETRNDVTWANRLPVGAITFQERATGRSETVPFGEMRRVTLSEKASAQGKRILLGLDWRGVPVDVYFTCTPHEIQLTVEASRDTKTHMVEGAILLPGLCSVSEHAKNFLVAPIGDGALLFAKDTPETPVRLPVWGEQSGLTMPFIGAVRENSALGLITDSAYAAAKWQKTSDSTASLDWIYTRDPERRRLDMRVVVLPEGDHIAIARAYREKIVGERNHVTLRKKMRERPQLEKLVGHVFADNPVAVLTPPDISSANRWDQMDTQLQAIRQALEENTDKPVGVVGGSDWSAIAVDFWQMNQARIRNRIPVPLQAAVYHDSVVAPLPIFERGDFLAALLRLSVPKSNASENPDARLLADLHQLTFPAFLTAHRFLTDDFLVEEAIYSDKTRIVINQRADTDYESDDLHLPPLGFYVAHAQMIAHDARRVGNERFETRACRIAQSLDNKPLSESENIRRDEFSVSSL